MSQTCAAIDQQPFCTLELKDNYTPKSNIEVEIDALGYNYFPLKEVDYVEIEPGDIIALKMQKPTKVMFGNAKNEDILLNLVDTNEKGEALNIRHHIRAILLIPTNISFHHNFTKPGMYKVRGKLTNDYSDDLKDEKDTFVRVISLMSGLKLEGPAVNCTKIDETATLMGTVETGINVTFEWTSEYYEDRFDTIEYASDIASENYTCETEGNITVYVNASDEFVYENNLITFCCTNIVSRNWMLKADDLQITPPGDVSFQFSYTGEEKYFPIGAEVDFDFGDGNSKSSIIFENEDSIIEETYLYELQGVYNVTVKVYNIFDEEFFNAQVTILEKMGNLEVFAQYSMDESQELTNLHGPDETDVPINSIVSFKCKISGSVDNYIMTLKDKTMEQTKEEDTFSNQFDEVGKYRVSFLAKNILEESNNVTLELRVMSEPAGLALQASSSDVLLDEELEFTISFEFIDQFTCILFDAGDEEIKQAFGFKEMCETLEDENFHFNSRHSDRKRRDAGEISWIDDNTISIIYAYRSDGVFKPVAKAFNTIFETNSSTKVKVSYPPSSIWIENNSTNIKRPMRFFREENFRLETTALLMDRPSNSYEMSWEVNKITDEEDVIDSIDISGIRSSSCSALRFPHRFLDVGLYKIRYFVIISSKFGFLYILL